MGQPPCRDTGADLFGSSPCWSSQWHGGYARPPAGTKPMPQGHTAEIARPTPASPPAGRRWRCAHRLCDIFRGAVQEPRVRGREPAMLHPPACDRRASLHPHRGEQHHHDLAAFDARAHANQPFARACWRPPWWPPRTPAVPHDEIEVSGLERRSGAAPAGQTSGRRPAPLTAEYQAIFGRQSCATRRARAGHGRHANGPVPAARHGHGKMNIYEAAAGS